MSIIILQLRNYSISVYQDRYTTSVVAKYLDTNTIKEKSEFHNTTLPHDMIFTKYYAFTIDKQVEALSIEYKINYRVCVG